MGNVRGNFYSRNHTQLVIKECVEEWKFTSYYPLYSTYVEVCTPKIIDKEKFWAFSFDEMGRYDVPAMVDHIKKVTGRKKVNYVGHSQGCVVLFSAVAQLSNQFSQNINKFFAFAPAASVSKMTTEYARYMNKTHLAYKSLKVNNV